MSDKPDITISPKTGEKIVLKSLLDFRAKEDIEPMTPDQSLMFLQLLAAESEDEKEGKLTPFDRTNLANNRHASVIAKVSEGFGFKVFAGRMHESTQLTIEVFFYVLNLCKGPGDAVMWCYTLHRLYGQDQELITLTSIANEWPWGFPTEDARHRCWISQKGYSHGVDIDNLIDRGVFWA
jgi:hypothetical protein